jgi:hypothetical protein
MQYGLLEGDLRRRDTDEEVDPVEGAQVQVLSAGVGDGTHMGQQLPGYRQLDGPHLPPVHTVLYTHTRKHIHVRQFFKFIYFTFI